MRDRLKEIAKENKIPFERALLEYVKEELLATLWSKGYGDCLWLRYSDGYGIYGSDGQNGNFTGRENHSLSFFYKENDRILPRDGFVPGAAYGEDFFNKLMSHVLIHCRNLRFQGFEVKGHHLKLQIQCQQMFVPVELAILPLGSDAVTPKQVDVTLPITGISCRTCLYPVENEAALCLGTVLSELELLSEMENYWVLYDIFSRFSIEGVRFQSALNNVLEKKNISPRGDNFSTVLGYRDYGYMQKKWDKMLKRQGLMSPNWSEVIDLLSASISPVWEFSAKEMVFFGDWMPEIRRYLD